MKPAKMNISLVMLAIICIYTFGLDAINIPTAELRTSNFNVEADETVTGVLSGFDCAVVGVLCPTTHRGADYTTGVFTEDEEFYFVVNIPQSFLQQYFREKVEVQGTVYDPYDHAVEPEIIHLVDGDERRLVYEEGYFIDENGHRATFQNGEFRDGKWVAQ
jgi:hypothetical protein